MRDLFRGLLMLVLFATFCFLSLAVPAVAQMPATGTAVDLSPIVNPIIQFAGTALTLILIPLFWAWWRKKAKEWHLEELRIEEQYRANIDDLAQKAIGWALAKIPIPAKGLTIDVKNELIATAGQKLVEIGADSLKQFDPKNVAEKARDIVQARLGLMETAAKGTPVPGPTTAAPAPGA